MSQRITPAQLSTNWTSSSSVACLGHIPFGLYASVDYLDKYGQPDFDNKCLGHTLVSLTHPQGQVADVSWLEAVASNARVAVRCNGREAQTRFALAGAGLCCLPRLMGDNSPGLALIDSPPAPIRKLWRGVPHATKDLPRLRAFTDFASTRIQELITP